MNTIDSFAELSHRLARARVCKTVDAELIAEALDAIPEACAAIADELHNIKEIVDAAKDAGFSTGSRDIADALRDYGKVIEALNGLDCMTDAGIIREKLSESLRLLPNVWTKEVAEALDQPFVIGGKK